MSGATGPLAGVKVVDLSVMISGPLAAMMLADQGADVIKVESPGIGDMMRHLGSQKGGITGIFALHNRGKKSIGLNLKSDKGRQILRDLMKDADVVIQNFRPGALEKLGFGYEDVRKFNDRVVYVSISGFGPDGPRSGQRVYDNVIQAASGLASVQTDKVTGRPQVFRTLVCDKVTSYTVAQAVTAALFARERGRGGQHIEISMLDSAIAFMWPDSAMDAALLDDDVARTPTIGENYAALELMDGFVTVSASPSPSSRDTARRSETQVSRRTRGSPMPRHGRPTPPSCASRSRSSRMPSPSSSSWRMPSHTTCRPAASTLCTTCTRSRRCDTTARSWCATTRRRVPSARHATRRTSGEHPRPCRPRRPTAGNTATRSSRRWASMHPPFGQRE